MFFSFLDLWSLMIELCCLICFLILSRFFCMSDAHAVTLASSAWSTSLRSDPFFFIDRCFVFSDCKQREGNMPHYNTHNSRREKSIFVFYGEENMKSHVHNVSMR